MLTRIDLCEELGRPTKPNLVNTNYITRVEINVSTERGAWALVCLTDLGEYVAPIDGSIFCVDEATVEFARMLERGELKTSSKAEALVNLLRGTE